MKLLMFCVVSIMSIDLSLFAATKNKLACYCSEIAQEHDITRLEFVCKNSKVNINLSDNKKRTMLHHFAMLGEAECLEIICRYRAELDAYDDEGKTALHLAAMHAHANCITVLLKYGCRLFIRDDNKQMPIHYAIESGCVKTVNAFLYALDNDNNYKYKLESFEICANKQGITARELAEESTTKAMQWVFWRAKNRHWCPIL